MTVQTASWKCLGGSPAGSSILRLSALTLAAILFTGGAATGFGQTQPDAAKPAPPVSEKKPATAPKEKVAHSYLMHQSVELGGRITSVSGSTAMWDTLNNQTTGMRLLGQSLELRSLDTHKTPFFDTLTMNSTGFGGDPLDVTRLNISKGRIYDFAGSFRRDRNFFDYNQFANSLDPTPGELIQQNNSMHLYNTVRRNTDAQITFLPLSVISFRLGMNHNTNEGPVLTTEHGTITGQVYQWFRNSADTFRAGVDVNIAKRTSISYDQFILIYKGDSSSTLPVAGQPLFDLSIPQAFSVSSPGTPGVAGSPALLAVPGLTLTSTATATKCGTAAVTGGGVTVASTSQAYFTNGIMSAYCKAETMNNHVVPIRSNFPTEQLRFSSHYWEKLVFNGRFSYSGGQNTINGYNWTQQGFSNTKTAYTASSKTWNNDTLGSVVTGSLANGQYSNVKRANVNGDFGFVAELGSRVSLSDSVSYSAFRNEGILGSQTITYTMPANLAPSLWTGINATGVVATTTTQTTSAGDNPTTAGSVQAGLPYSQSQKITQNTALISMTIIPQVKISAGYRYKVRALNYTSLTGYVPTNDMLWHENSGLLGAVIEPGRAVRINLNYEIGASASANSATLSDTFTRTAPNGWQHFKARATIKPARWINFAATGNVYAAKNDDSQVNHKEHNEDLSFASTIIASDKLSFDLSYAYDEVYSVTDSCFGWNATTPANAYTNPPFGATSSGACLLTATNNGNTLLYNNYYKAPSSFYLASFTYTPVKQLFLNGGVRYNAVHGTEDILNPIQTPGSLDSRNLRPFADAEIKMAQQWAWHANWAYDGYGETGALNAVTNGLTSNGLPSRNMHGNVLTLGVKYAF